uniref:Conserved oligomeric Golgi complex subunit 1 n=1 Tax=Caenorhabditis tropicalis TaxID=1561998 RepID=A0A1I7TKK2_9PELO
MTNLIVATRSELEEQNISTLIDVSRPDWATNQLAAIALLQGKDIEQLLDLYLEKRYDYILRLIEDSATILNIVDEMKKTLHIVEELFVHGELIHAIHSVCNGQYKCELIREMCADQAFAFEKTIYEDMDRVWRQMREKLSGRGSGTLPSQLVVEKCSAWIDRTSTLTHKLVSEVCEYFDSLDQIVDLLQAITLSLKQDWPKIGSCRVVYDKLLQTAVVDKAKILLTEMIAFIEISAKKRFESTNDGPPTAIFDDRTYRPDSNSHIGISTQLYKCVKTLWESLEKVNEKCCQFEAICAPMADMATASAMKETMATSVLELLLRLCELHSDKSNGSARFLARARLALALVHSESTLISTLLDKDSNRITSLNQRLHSIIEKNLG